MLDFKFEQLVSIIQGITYGHLKKNVWCRIKHIGMITMYMLQGR